MSSVDVAVVGAGPAGSTAAWASAKGGAVTWLIEKKREIGTPVQCGGFLPEAHELSQLMPRASLPQSLVEVPDRCVLHHTYHQRMYSPSGRSVEFPVSGRVVDRRSLDRHLAQEAARAGAEVIPATRAELKGGGLQLRGHRTMDLEVKVIIGADGPSSRLARSMVAGPREHGICLEYEMVDLDIDSKAAEMYFGTRFAPGGYAWIIPTGGDTANVGVGIRRSYAQEGQTLDDLLSGFIFHHPAASNKLEKGKVVAVMSGLVPAGGMPARICEGNVLLAGDAAGQVMATSGGGIPLAMVAGTIAGEVASAYLLGEASLEEYPRRIEEAFGRELRNSVTIRRLVDAAMFSDRSMDLLFSLLDGAQIKEIQRGRIPGRFGQLCRMLIHKNFILI